MSARAIHRGRATDIPPDVYVAIARDAKAFDAMLADWDKRRSDAQEAERIAGERLTKAEEVFARARGEIEKLAERGSRLNAEGLVIEARAAEAEDAAKAVTAREVACDDRDTDLRRREETLAADRDKALAAIKALLP